jgi:gluconolactonase
MKHSRREVLSGLAVAAVGAPSLASGLTGLLKRDSVDPLTKVEVFDGSVSDLIDPSEKAETLGTGYKWSEGPAWDKNSKRLYFTDVPSNKAFVWSKGKSVEVFLDPSGAALGGVKGFREPGANGLLLAYDGRLLICNHGKRALEAMNISTGERETLVSTYNGKALNSPNDVIQASGGDIYFTDPPYGLEGLNASPLKEMKANGVYHLGDQGTVRRLVDDMTFPNGIALSPDEKYLYVSQSDPEKPVIRRVDLIESGSDEVWFDAGPHMKDGPGLPDGMAVTTSGHIFATGPGGVLILNANGDLVGRINTGRATANCTFGEDGHTLFITAHDRLLSIRTKARGVAWS